VHCAINVHVNCCRTNVKKLPSSLAASDLVNSEQSIMSTFDFLASENVDDDDEDDDDDDEDGTDGDSRNGHDTGSMAQQLLAHTNRLKVCHAQETYESETKC